jgi:hypothetical protein
MLVAEGKSIMIEPKKPPQRVQDLALSQEAEAQLGSRIQRVLESNKELATALKRLRESYQVMQGGSPIHDADEILEQVETALSNAEKIKIVI